MSPLLLTGLAGVLILLAMAFLIRRKPRREVPAYYRTRHWAEFSKAIKEKHGNCCAVCGTDWQRKRGVRLQVHHFRYRDGEGRSLDFREGEDDVTCLCSRHHRKGAYGPDRVRRDRRWYLAGKFVRWVLFLPFRLLGNLVRSDGTA